MKLWIKDEAHARQVLALPKTSDTYADRVAAQRFLGMLAEREQEQTRVVQWYDVPAGTKPERCKGKICRGRLYWITSPNTGAKLPIDCAPGIAPTADRAGRGVSHFTTCPDARQFSRSKKR